MTLGDFLNNQATKLGLQNNPHLTSILSNSELANREIPDEFAKQLDGGLMSLESAKNNAGLKSHFFSQALNGIDTKLVDDLDLDEDVISSIKNEQNTYGKIGILKEQIKLLKSKKDTAGDKTKQADYEAQIKKLNEQIVSIKEAHDSALKGAESKHQNEILGFIVRNSLSNKPYANKDLKPEVNATVAKALIDAALAQSGAVVVRDGETLKLKQASNPEMDYYQDNRAVSFDDFSNKILAENKLLAVSGQGNNNPPANNPTRTVLPGGNDERKEAYIANQAQNFESQFK